MDVLLTLAVLTLVSIISGLQTCSLGTETSSTQILLDESTTQINTGGGMCSCRLTVSQTTQVNMFTGSWTPQCDSYMIIQKWRTSTQCTNGVVQTLPAQTHTVTTDEEIWILVVAKKPGARILSGQLQLKDKQQSAQLNIECFEPNTNSSTTATPTTTTTTTVPTTTVTNMKTSTRPTTSTEKPSATSTTDSRPQGQTTSGAATGDTSTSSSAGVTSGSSATSAGSTQASSNQDAITNNTKGTFPGGIYAAGIAAGIVLVLIAGGLYVVISRRKLWTSSRQKPDDIPISEAHPTYSGFTSRTEESINTYDKLDPKPSKGTDNPYINVS